MAKEKYQTRLAADDADRLEEYRDEHDLSQSEAVRRLIRTGLEADDPATERAAQRGTIITVVVIGVIAFLTLVILNLLSLGVI